MRPFVLKVLAFCLAFLCMAVAPLVAVALLVPPTPRASTSLLFAKRDKDVLLRDTPGPRLILVGGSNLSFGVDSQLLRDELGMNPVNTGLTASLGLKYMMDSTLPYVRRGDVVVVVPEYSHFYGGRAHGGEELLRTVIDVDRRSISTLTARQWANVARYLPKLALSKLWPGEYFFRQSAEPGVYERRSFNRYGDVSVHWTRAREPFAPYEPASGPFDETLIADIRKFEEQVLGRGALLYVSFPGFQAASFANLRGQIAEVETRLRESGLVLLGTPGRYALAEKYMFNTPYHLNKQGVDLRTRRLIADLRAHGLPGPDRPPARAGRHRAEGLARGRTTAAM